MSNSFVHKIWVGIIDRAEKRGRFTDYDKERAMDWNCCAVGERDQACDKLIDGLPDSQDAIAQSTLTDRAYTLGTQFYNNAVLTDQTGLSNLTSVGGDIHINGNTITNIDGFSGLTSMYASNHPFQRLRKR